VHPVVLTLWGETDKLQTCNSAPARHAIATPSPGAQGRIGGLGKDLATAASC